MKNVNVSKSAIFTLAWSLYQANLFTTFSQALKEAWKQAKSDTIALLVFTKKSGEETKRVVSQNILNYYEPKGAGRPRPEGLKLFADMLKVAQGIVNPIISAYESRIISLA